MTNDEPGIGEKYRVRSLRDKNDIGDDDDEDTLFTRYGDNTELTE